ncbi:2-C-methyl-D-erythritol 4-phosphate cytidylyltransferase [Candidatus Providencia siddallii]|uniref:2-C-methyl-D-erythritol 4-phosphate cytidylyltransferase n=1 Tax=Candidatus Providencia siddallii TaxID=1715285 RepID=A0ABP1CD39_9GAMM
MINKKKSSKKIVAIVPAAGIGIRMNSDLPKQYLLVAGKTIIEHTIYTLLLNKNIKFIVVVLNVNDRIFCNLDIVKNSKIITVIGGKERSDSILAGLNFLFSNFYDYWVLIHDAVRPCLHQDDLNKLFRITVNGNCCGGILGIPVRDTIKCSFKNYQNIRYTIDRKNLWYSLTPQIFPLSLLRYCLLNLKKKIFTDESSVLEYYGYNPIIVIGRTDNLKVTYPEDLLLVEFYLLKMNIWK